MKKKPARLGRWGSPSLSHHLAKFGGSRSYGKGDVIERSLRYSPKAFPEIFLEVFPRAFPEAFHKEFHKALPDRFSVYSFSVTGSFIPRSGF